MNKTLKQLALRKTLLTMRSDVHRLQLQQAWIEVRTSIGGNATPTGIWQSGSVLSTIITVLGAIAGNGQLGAVLKLASQGLVLMRFVQFAMNRIKAGKPAESAESA
ncbi:MAG: hypothetical protein H0W44_03785 [Gammaproteobacteria bacterium]|nr:hypothetical protein [Gammaproteobacteria bacterium]